MRAHPAGPRHGEIPADHTSVVPVDLNDLDPAVWPRAATRSGGAMTLAGNDVRDLAARYGTPLLAMDEQDFRSRCQDFADAFGSAADVHYAAKAFLTSHIVKWLAQEGLSLDVCSGGELRLANLNGAPTVLRLQSGFPSAKDTFLSDQTVSAVAFNRDGFASATPTVTQQAMATCRPSRATSSKAKRCARARSSAM